jgi:hypothetical protein
MPFMSSRLLDAMADKAVEEHYPTDDIESHAWVLLWEFAFACVENKIDVAHCKGRLETLQMRNAGVLGICKIGIIQSFMRPYRLPPSLRTLSLVLGPWFKILELAQGAMWQQKTAQGSGGSPEDAQAQMQKILEAAYQQCILSVDQSVLAQLPETWAELRVHQATPDYNALIARVDQIKLEIS